VIHELFRHIFTGLEERYAEELAIIRAQYPSEPVQFTDKPLVIHWAEGMQMLRDAGHEVSRHCVVCMDIMIVCVKNKIIVPTSGRSVRFL
jgi:hypothetical protein